MIAKRPYRIGLLVLCVVGIALTPLAALGHVPPELGLLMLAAVAGWIVNGQLTPRRDKRQAAGQAD